MTMIKQEELEFILGLAKKSWEILQAGNRKEDYADVLIQQQKALGVK